MRDDVGRLKFPLPQIFQSTTRILPLEVQNFFGLKGKNALGNNFVISSQTFLENDPGYSDNFSAFSIVATEDNTLVTIIPSYDIVGHLGNIPFNITLNEGQVYVAQEQIKQQELTCKVHLLILPSQLQ